MKISISYLLIFSLFPVLIFSALIPFAGGSIFDYFILPFLSLYALIRFQPAMSRFLIKWPAFIYICILMLVFFIRFALANDSDFIIAGTGMRLLMPVSFLIIFIDFFNYISRINLSLKEKIVKSLFASYLLTMITIMVISFANGAGEFGLGLSFPLYTENQIDRHVYGPSIACLAIFCCLGLLSVGKNILPKQFLFLMFIALILGLLSSVASGSRSPFAMYAIAIAYVTTIQLFKNRLFLILKILFFSSFLFIVIFVFQNLASEYSGLINRAFGVFEAILDPASDVSRGGVYENTIKLFSNPDNWLVGLPSTIGASDSGVLNLLINGGLPLLFSFLALWITTLFLLPYSSLKILAVSILGQFLIGSETLFIPRYLLVISFPVFIFALFSLSHSPISKLRLRTTSPLLQYKHF